jgi:CRISPR-associated protein Cmr2
MSTSLWDAKLIAYLHDPPHKVVCLSQRVAHEEQSGQLLAALGLSINTFERQADHLAAAADRPASTGNLPIDWCAKPSITRVGGGEVTWVTNRLAAAVGSVSATALTAEIVQILQEIRDLDAKQRFFWVWRLLRPTLQQTGKGRPNCERIGPWWDVLPADTRIPDHTIWSHARLVSAVHTSLPQPALLEFRLGPVQSFIRQARRTRDLWASSWLLSYLAAWGAWRLSQETGPDSVLFPDLSQNPLIDLWLRQAMVGAPSETLLTNELSEVAAMPNRFVALVPFADTEKLAGLIVESIRQRYADITGEARKFAEMSLRNSGTSAASSVDTPEWKSYWHHVENCFPEISWVAVAFPANLSSAGFYEVIQRANDLSGDAEVQQSIQSLKTEAAQSPYQPNPASAYKLLYRLLQDATDSRKQIRIQSQWSGEGERCTVCGERPCIPLVSTIASRSQQIAAWSSFAHALLRHTQYVWIRLDGREMVCGLCLAKRGLARAVEEIEQAQWSREPRFPSTAAVATVEWRRKVDQQAQTNENLAKALQQLKQTASSANADREMALYREPRSAALSTIDARLLIAENTSQVEDEYSPEHAKALIEAATELRRVVKKEVSGLGSPSGYFAILAMDGDNLGKWLSGASPSSVTLGDVVHPDVRSQMQDGLHQPAPYGPSRHAGLSAELNDFAIFGVPAIIEETYGALVYSGGDDVLAFLSPSKVFDAALKLRLGFAEGGGATLSPRRAFLPYTQHTQQQAAGASTSEGMHYWLGTGLTMSAGIAIAHHMTDLRAVIEAAFEMEEKAKEPGGKKKGRDALSIAVLKRSGERLEVWMPWFATSNNGGKLASLDVLQDWLSAFSGPASSTASTAAISPSILGDLRAERAIACADIAGKAKALTLRLEFLISRHSRAPGASQPSQAASLAEKTVSLWKELVSRGWAEEEAWDHACLNLIAVAAFLAREHRQ